MTYTLPKKGNGTKDKWKQLLENDVLCNGFFCVTRATAAQNASKALAL